MSTCLEAQGIQSLGLYDVSVVESNSVGLPWGADELIGIVYIGAPAGCDIAIRFTNSSDSRPCGLAIVRIAVLQYSEVEILINLLTQILILVSILSVVRA